VFKFSKNNPQRNLKISLENNGRIAEFNFGKKPNQQPNVNQFYATINLKNRTEHVIHQVIIDFTFYKSSDIKPIFVQICAEAQVPKSLQEAQNAKAEVKVNFGYSQCQPQNYIALKVKSSF